MNYLSFTAEDFAVDAFFCLWVLEPTPDAEAFWLDWLRNNPYKRNEVELARQMVLIASSDDGVSPSAVTVERIWEGIEQGKQTNVHPLQGRRVIWMKVAAAIILLALAFGGYLYKNIQNHTFHTAYGESRRLSLPDGSLVTLNANSELRVSDNWGQPAEREVWLEGEAFFHVSKIKKEGLPVKFVVHTPDLVVEVKGTQFNVNTRKNQTRVVLSEGLVQLELHGKESEEKIQMTPGDLVDFSKNNQLLSIRHVRDTTPLYSWKNNQWTLNDTSLDEIAVLIQETYGVTVSIQDDSLARKKVNGIVPTDNLEDLLSSLESILYITVERKAGHLTIKNR